EIASLPDNFSVESVEKLRVPQLEGERHLVIIKSNKV
ncbi:16S rRNA (guanine(527)-N(7))-methyltransferase RsmG, partial [Salmonella enterica subsp. salamae]